jgi:hypothetical protein
LRWVVDAVATTRVYLGNNYQVITALEHTLDAGEGFAAWLWHDGSTGQTYTINTPGNNICSVTVTDPNGCTDSHQVQILLIVPDIGVVDIIHPQTACESEEITVAIKNHGNANISSITRIQAVLEVNGQQAVTEDVALASAFGAGETIYHTFSNTAGINVPGHYQVTAYTIFASDLDNSNDTLTSGFEIFGAPEIDLGNGSDTLSGSGQAVLTAPPGYSSYLWQDGSTENTFTVNYPASDWFHVEVTDHNGCRAADSVYVIMHPPGLEIISVTGPVDACESAAVETIGLELRNSGMYPLEAGEQIDFYYRINQQPAVGGSYTLGELLPPQAVLSYTFASGAVLAEPGRYDIRIWFEYGSDGDLPNSSLVHTTVIHGFPEVDLASGKDTLYASLPVTLDAGEGFASYVWDDGSTLQTRQVSIQGTYNVTVTDQYGCPGSASVTVESPLSTTAPGNSGLEIMIYPNPASEYLNIDVRSDAVYDRLRIELVTPAGVTVYRKEAAWSDHILERIDTGGLPAGLYIMKIMTGSSATTRVIVIN